MQILLDPDPLIPSHVQDVQLKVFLGGFGHNREALEPISGFYFCVCPYRVDSPSLLVLVMENPKLYSCHQKWEVRVNLLIGTAVPVTL